MYFLFFLVLAYPLLVGFSDFTKETSSLLAVAKRQQETWLKNITSKRKKNPQIVGIEQQF